MSQIVKERPITMIDDMVRAILDGRKTQTRRPIKLQPIWKNQPCPGGGGAFFDDLGRWFQCPYGKPGDKLWVRETWDAVEWEDKTKVYYRADPLPDRYEWSKERGDKWRPSIYMPRWASRILLEITEVRVEQVQKISRADAKSEGFLPSQGDGLEHFGGAKYGNAEKAFRVCWDFRYAKHGAHFTTSGFDWDSNPWVWVISFRRLEGEE